MHTSRDFLVRLARFGYWLGLVALATVGAAAIVLSTPAAVKQAARDSQVYEAITDMLTDQSGGQLGPAVQPAIENAAAQAFTPQQLQAAAEQVIDGTYRWLDGTVPQPDFRVDLTPLSDGFLQSLGTAASARLAGLPACGPEQLRGLDPQSIDPSSLNCLPPGLTPQAAQDQVMARLRQSNPLLSQPVLTADSLPKDQQGRTVFQTADNLPVIHQVMSAAPWLIGAYTVLMAAWLFWLYRRPLKAAYGLARTTLWAGLLILGVAGIGHLLFSVLTQPGGSIAASVEGTPQAYLLAFMRSLEGEISRLTLLFAAGYAVAGWLLMAGLRLVAARQLRATAQPAGAAVTTLAAGQKTDGQASKLESEVLQNK